MESLITFYQLGWVQKAINNPAFVIHSSKRASRTAKPIPAQSTTTSYNHNTSHQYCSSVFLHRDNSFLQKQKMTFPFSVRAEGKDVGSFGCEIWHQSSFFGPLYEALAQHYVGGCCRPVTAFINALPLLSSLIIDLKARVASIEDLGQGYAAYCMPDVSELQLLSGIWWKLQIMNIVAASMINKALPLGILFYI